MISKTPALFLLPAMLSLALACSEKSTKPQDGVIEGMASWEGQQDHGGIVVELRELGRRVTTSTDGGYRFSSIPPGVYSLLAVDGDTTRYLFDFVVVPGISVRQGGTTTAPAIELPLFHRVETDLSDPVLWTAAGGPYLIAQSITVLPGAVLTIESGTAVKFSGYHRLSVQGRLSAKGTANDSIFFTTAQLEGSAGDWDRIDIQGSKDGAADTLSYCRIQYANVGLSCQQASPVIFNNDISHCLGYGIVADLSTPEISSNLLRDNYGGISCENNSGAIITDNIIENNVIAGISCNSSSPQISDNIIAQNKFGLDLENSSDPQVRHNQLSLNEDGVYLHYYCSPCIAANDISGQSRYGLYLSGYNVPQIHFNNISQNANYSLFLTFQPDDIQAQQNWWGSDDINDISGCIWDQHDDSNLGEVLLSPVLEAPVDSAGPRSSP